mgnify:CR=1 FL=1
MSKQEIMVTPDGRKLEFKHWRGEFNRRPFRANGEFITCAHWTELRVFTADETLWAAGDSFCSPEDRLDYEVGRQRAVYSLLTKLPKGCKGGAELKAAYLTRPGALPWALDKHGHLVPGILDEHRKNRAFSKRLQRKWRERLAQAEKLVAE